MPAFNPPILGGSSAYPSLTYGQFGLATTSTNVISSASANTKGAYVSLGTLTQDTDGLRLSCANSGARQIVLDVRANGSVVVSDFPVTIFSSRPRFKLPIRVAAGALEVRISAPTASLGISFQGFGGQADIAQAATIIEPIGPVGATVQGVGITIDAPGIVTSGASWTQVNASGIANDILGILPFVGPATKTGSRTANTYTLEIGTGPNSGSVVSIGVSIPFDFNTVGAISDTMDWLDQSFDAGTIFWVRLTAANANTDPANVQLMARRR